MVQLVKDVLRVAKYRPDPANPDFVVDVTPAVLDHWSRTFNDMKEAGIGIPVPWEHPPRGDENSDPMEWAARKTGDPRVNAGWVDSVYRDGDTLYSVLDIKDEYADDLQKSGCYVSPKFGGSWTDSQSRLWTNPIHHIALTTKPVAVNQTRKFTPVASPVMAFSRAMCFSTSQWSQPEESNVADLTPAEAMDRLFENPNFVEMARERLGMPVSEFSADVGAPPGMPPGMPQGLPGEGAPEPQPQPEPDNGGTDAVSICMQILHQLSQTLGVGMKALAKLGGVDVGDDDEGDAAPPPGMSPAPPQVQAQPAAVSFSREEIEANPVFAAMEKKLSKIERSGLADRIEALFDTGRCTRPQADALAADAGKYEFARQSDQPNVILIEKIKLLESMPENAALPLGGKESEFSREITSSKPRDTGEEMSDERAEEIVRAHFGIK